MRFYVQFTLFFVLTAQSYGMDSFSILRNLGTNGEMGSDVLELICVKNNCKIVSIKNEEIKDSIKILEKDAKTVFDEADRLIKKQKNIATTQNSPSPIKVVLEWKNKKTESTNLDLSLISLEGRLRARLRK